MSSHVGEKLIGNPLPEINLRRIRDGIETVDTHTLFEARNAVLFAVPGAFTPTCSGHHLPGYIKHFDAFRRRGIDVFCIAVNDPFVMQAWGASLSIPQGLQMLSDGNGDLSRALGLEMDASSSGMGVRSRRYALYLQHGVVRAAFIDDPGQFEVSSAEHVLAHLPH